MYSRVLPRRLVTHDDLHWRYLRFELSMVPVRIMMTIRVTVAVRGTATVRGVRVAVSVDVNAGMGVTIRS